MSVEETKSNLITNGDRYGVRWGLQGLGGGVVTDDTDLARHS